jgi:hypothetical protein
MTTLAITTNRGTALSAANETSKESPPAPSPAPLALLPSPTTADTFDMSDAIVFVMALEAQSRDAAHKAHVATKNNADNINKAVAAEVEKKYKEWLAEQNNPFKAICDIFKGVAIGLSAVVAACTGGTLSGLMLGAVALSAASFIVDKTEMFGKDSPFASLGLNIASAAVGIVGAIGGIAASASGIAPHIVGKAAGVIKASASAGNAVVQFGGGLAEGGSAIHEFSAQNTHADLEEKRNMQKAAQRYIEMIILGLTNLEKSHRKAVETLSKAQGNANHALILSAKMG